MIKKVISLVTSKVKPRVIVASVISVLLIATVAVVAFGNQMVCIRDGEESVMVMTMHTDVKKILDQAGIEYDENDEIIRNNDNSSYSEITILRAFDVKVTADGEVKNVTLTKGLVPDALAAAGVEMDTNDVLNVPQYAPLSNGMNIKVDRVEYKEVTVTKDVPYEVKLVEKTNMKQGDVIWIQYGVNGKSEVVENRKYVNGVLDSTEIVSEKVLVEPVVEEKWIGVSTESEVSSKNSDSNSSSSNSNTTKNTTSSSNSSTKNNTSSSNSSTKNNTSSSSSSTKNDSSSSSSSTKNTNSSSTSSTKNDTTSSSSSATSSKEPSSSATTNNNTSSTTTDNTEKPSSKTFVDSSGKTVSYSRLIQGKCTAYTFNNGHNITASGMKAAYGRIAVNPKQISYGTNLYVVSPDGGWVYGYCVAADTGGFATNGSGTVADLFYNTKSECITFGRRTMNIYVLD